MESLEGQSTTKKKPAWRNWLARQTFKNDPNRGCFLSHLNVASSSLAVGDSFLHFFFVCHYHNSSCLFLLQVSYGFFFILEVSNWLFGVCEEFVKLHDDVMLTCAFGCMQINVNMRFHASFWISFQFVTRKRIEFSCSITCHIDIRQNSSRTESELLVISKEDG